MSLGHLLYAAAVTLRISVPTIVDAMRGKLTPEVCDARLDWWSKRLLARQTFRCSSSGVEQIPSRESVRGDVQSSVAVRHSRALPEPAACACAWWPKPSCFACQSGLRRCARLASSSSIARARDRAIAESGPRPKTRSRRARAFGSRLRARAVETAARPVQAGWVSLGRRRRGAHLAGDRDRHASDPAGEGCARDFRARRCALPSTRRLIPREFGGEGVGAAGASGQATRSKADSRA